MMGQTIAVCTLEISLFWAIETMVATLFNTQDVLVHHGHNIHYAPLFCLCFSYSLKDQTNIAHRETRILVEQI